MFNNTGIGQLMTGINYVTTKPGNPKEGDCYFDPVVAVSYVWTGTLWEMFSISSSRKTIIENPTPEQLEKHPALKQSWEEYLTIRKLLGI